MFDFKNKIVIVTGGAGGIGRGISLEFARAGAQVICADVDQQAGDQLILEARSYQGEIHFVYGNMELKTTYTRIIEKAKELGGVDVLCNNVGIQPPGSYVPIDELSEELWDHIITVNLKSFFLMTKYCIPLLKSRGEGVIINTASVQGIQSMKGVAAYAASKGGIIALTKQLALEYAEDNIRVLAIAPGTILTPLLKEVIEGIKEKGYKERLVNAYPMKRLGKVEEVAKVVTFLSSNAASFMTGECVTIDGGIMAKGGWA